MRGGEAIMKKNIRYFAFLLALLILSVSAVSCGTDASAGTIKAINEDGSMIIVDKNGNEYTVSPYVPPETDETVKAGSSIANVVEFGAKGNGTDDDTEAVKSALNSLEKGGVLYFPAGSYNISSTIDVTSGELIIRGDGTSSRICYTNATSSLFRFADGISDVSVRDLDILCVSEDVKVGSNVALSFGLCSEITIENVCASGFGSAGIVMGAPTGEFSKHIMISNCKLMNNLLAGIKIGKVDGISVTACDLSQNGEGKSDSSGYGVYVSKESEPKNIRVFANRIYDNTFAGVYMLSGEDMIITDNSVVSNSLYGIYASGEKVNHVIISNNFITETFSASIDQGYGRNILCAIYAGIESAIDERATFSVMNNVIKDLNLTNGTSYGFMINVNDMTSLILTDNILEGNTLTGAVMVKNCVNGSSVDTDIHITSNMFKVRNCTAEGIKLSGAEKVSFSQNKIFFDKISGSSCISLEMKEGSKYLSSYNIISAGEGSAKAVSFSVSEDKLVIAQDADIFNGQEIK